MNERRRLGFFLDRKVVYSVKQIYLVALIR